MAKKKRYGLVFRILSNIRGWFVHIRDIIYQPILIRDNTIIVLCEEIESLDFAPLKKDIKRKASRRKVEKFLNAVIRKNIDPRDSARLS